MKTIDFTVSEISASHSAMSALPEQMSLSFKTAGDCCAMLGKRLEQAIAQTNSSLEIARKDKVAVANAIAVTAATAERLQAIADAPPPEGESAPPPPKNLERAKRNLERLKAIQKNIVSSISALESQAFALKKQQTYLQNSYSALYSTYGYHSSVLSSTVSYAGKALSAASSAMYVLGAGDYSRMECDDPSYLNKAAESLRQYADSVSDCSRRLGRSTSSFSAQMQDNVSRKAAKATEDSLWQLGRELESIEKQSAKLRDAASYLETYLQSK